MVLDLLVAAIAVGLIWLGVANKNTTTGGEIGVGLNLILVTNTTLLRLVEAWTDLEISLGAVARLREADQDTPKEDQPGEILEPAEEWPVSGQVVIANLTAGYRWIHLTSVPRLG